MENIKDIHAHFFNLKYLPVAGIIRRYSNNKIPVVIALGLEWFLWRKTRASFQEDQEEKIIPENITSNRLMPQEMFDVKLMSKEVGLMTEEELLDLASSLLNEVDVIDTPLAGALEAYQNMEENSFKAKLRFYPRSHDEFYTTDEKLRIVSFFREMFKWAMNILDRIGSAVNSGINHLRWFMVMMKSEEEMFRQIQHDNEGVGFYLHHLMDVDHYFVDEETSRFYNSYYSFFPSQVKRMKLLQDKYPDRIVGFVAFSPARRNSLSHVQKAISDGFKGIKFYPPMGYRPSGNTRTEYIQPIADLMNYCIGEEVALFAHCNNSGFQAFPRENSGANSNPVYWEQLLMQTGYQGLRLCLGHGGGGEGWFSENKDTDHINVSEILASHISDDSETQKDWNRSYAAMVFKLCVNYKNVYCDFSYLDDMIRPDGSVDNLKRENFILRLSKLLTLYPEFGSKIIYGSDWHMLYRENKQKVYYPVYKEMFEDQRLSTIAEGFFRTNIKSYLRM